MSHDCCELSQVNNACHQVRKPEKFWGSPIISISPSIFLTYFQIDKMEYKRKEKNKARDLGKGYVIMKDEHFN